jgi:glutaredoxin-like protein NrdH
MKCLSAKQPPYLEKEEPLMTIDLYSKTNCMQCVATKRTLDSKGAKYTTTDLTMDEAALTLAKGLGHMAAPVVLIRDAANNIVDHWSGFRPEKIAEYAN